MKGEKGTLFVTTYIERFHEMEKALQSNETTEIEKYLLCNNKIKIAVRVRFVF